MKNKNKKIKTTVYQDDESNGDKAHRIVRSGLGAIPFAGQSAIEIFNSIVTPPIERRKEQWINEVTELLDDLVQKKFLTLDEIQNNDEFLDVILTATSIAIKNNKQEKREYLRNCVFNTLLDDSIKEALLQTYLNYIEQLTPWHIKILNVFSEGFCWIRTKRSTSREDQNPIQVSHAFVHQFTDIVLERETVMYLISDLETKELIRTHEVTSFDHDEEDNLYKIKAATLYGQLLSLDAKHKGNFGTENTNGFITVTSSLGENLLNFIKSPLTGEISGTIENN